MAEVQGKGEKAMAKNQKKFVDDGRTVYSMEGLSKKKPSDGETLGLTKEEKKAAIKAAFIHFTPLFLGVLACFAATFALMHLWLS